MQASQQLAGFHSPPRRACVAGHPGSACFCLPPLTNASLETQQNWFLREESDVLESLMPRRPRPSLGSRLYACGLPSSRAVSEAALDQTLVQMSTVVFTGHLHNRHYIKDQTDRQIDNLTAALKAKSLLHRCINPGSQSLAAHPKAHLY